MSKSNTFENDLLKLIFNATGISNLSDNASASPVTNLYVSLHIGDPGEAGNQSTSEVSYTGYARVAVSRTTGGWVVTDNSVSPVNDILFAVASAGTGTVTHFAVGTAVSGAGKILYKGALTPSIAIAAGVQPKLSSSTSITED